MRARRPCTAILGTQSILEQGLRSALKRAVAKASVRDGGLDFPQAAGVPLARLYAIGGLAEALVADEEDDGLKARPRRSAGHAWSRASARPRASTPGRKKAVRLTYDLYLRPYALMHERGLMLE